MKGIRSIFKRKKSRSEDDEKDNNTNIDTASKSSKSHTQPLSSQPQPQPQLQAPPPSKQPQVSSSPKPISKSPIATRKKLPRQPVTNHDAQFRSEITDTTAAPSSLFGASIKSQLTAPSASFKTTSSMKDHSAATAPSTRRISFSEDTTKAHDRKSSSKITNKGVSESFVSPATKFEEVEEQEDVQEQNIILQQQLAQAYEAIPMLEHTKLPRGGISFATKAVGRVQYGIPPETIKDSMTLGIPVPQVYIVPAERFCREMGPALGVNLAEFEFPAYFNFFVYKKQCTLVVDSPEAQDNICRVFGETLLGPAQFRKKPVPKNVEGADEEIDDDNSTDSDVIDYEPEDFAPEFPKEKIPNLRKELGHFRKLPDGSELVLEKLLDFCLFQMPGDGASHEELGIPPGMANVVKEQEEIERSSASDAGENDVSTDEVDDAVHVPKDLEGVENMVEGEKWSYKKARWAGDVATVWPPGTTEEQKKNRSSPRVEIFKMPNGTEFILHDVDVNNHIIGKARFSGHVKVSESMGVNGFGQSPKVPTGVIHKKLSSKSGSSDNEDGSVHSESTESLERLATLWQAPPTFHAPSFGVTVLGNSHGFDKNGSVSGYVLWINGRGVMIDPPPYASATLEREGIRPRTIVGIILTHCHADHDAGAFQKVLTGSPVVVITTPTIYKSFIRKYAALASLSPALLRHSHRHKPAIIGQALRFQGATFYFTYSLHAIPCIAFRVEWRGRSIVFTGDHFGSPEGIDKLETSGVLSKARADDLRQLPLQETDVLLHESGAPPIHTPLDVLLKLPKRVKQRMYVVHTSSLPEGCELKVAPTGTEGTIRLDTIQRSGSSLSSMSSIVNRRNSRDAYSVSLDEGEALPSPWSGASTEYSVINEESDDFVADKIETTFANVGKQSDSSSSFGGSRVGKKSSQRTSLVGVGGSPVPLVSLRPASSTDAWFILNLLSSVPFMSSLSYSTTMEVLETARVDAFCKNDVVLHHKVRKCTLCVIWEGTCVERYRTPSSLQSPPNSKEIEQHPPKIRGSGSARSAPSSINEQHSGAVWHAGDWTGPISLQPDKHLSGESDTSTTHDIVAESSEGVKVITIDFAALHSILVSGSALYRKYLERRAHQEKQANLDGSQSTFSSMVTQKMLADAMKRLNVIELLDMNSALQRLSAVQKRHLECLAEGPVAFSAGDRLWRSGEPVNRAFLIVAGTTSFVQRRRNAGSASLPVPGNGRSSRNGVGHNKRTSFASTSSNDAVDEMGADMVKAIEELGDINAEDTIPEITVSVEDHIRLDALFSRNSITGATQRLSEAQDYAKLSKDLQRRADLMMCAGSQASDISISSSIGSESTDRDHESDSGSAASRAHREKLIRHRSSRARHNNKVLGRLYSRRAFTGNLVFSRGHFLGDVSKMVAGLLLSDQMEPSSEGRDESLPSYGFGDKPEGGRGVHTEDGMMDNLTDMVIHEQEPDSRFVHDSTLAAGKEGCVVLFFPKSSLIPFLDEFPGLLLSLLGTQVVV